jgi:DNA-directed RNA polymerase, mitochondrial
MGHTGWKRLNDQNTVEGDLRDATWIGDRTFYLDYSCDERGRMYALQRFSYDREDHVRSLIEFDHGVYCGPYGIQWLEINCATLYGVDKLILGERLQWAGKKRSFIRAVARDPIGTLDRWRGADRPLQFVRSCIELVDAYDNPDHLTRLPIGIDATASGLQHLALLCRDFKTMEQVNLTLWHNRVMDIYDRVAARVQASIQGDSHEWAAWWLKRLEELGDKRRKLFKGPVSTFSYASTEPSWNKQIRDAYDELERLSEPLPRDSDGNLIKRGDKSAVGYLVDEVRLACEAELPGPSAVMQWLKDRVSRQYDRNTFVSWDSPSGFPCRNLEETPNLVEVNLPGQRRKIIVADGVLPEMDLEEMLKSITANFTHSLDAAHAARTI